MKCLSADCGYAAHATGHAEHPKKGAVAFVGWCCGRCKDKGDGSHGPCCQQVAHSFADVSAEVKRRRGLTAQLHREACIAMGYEEVVIDGRHHWMDVKEWSVGDWEFDADDYGFLNQLRRNWRAHDDAIDGDNDAVKHPGDPPISDPDGDRALRDWESETLCGDAPFLFNSEPMSTKVEEVDEVEEETLSS